MPSEDQAGHACGLAATCTGGRLCGSPVACTHSVRAVLTRGNAGDEWACAVRSLINQE